MAKHFKQTAKKTRRLIYIVLIILIIIATIYIVFFIRGKNNTIQESSALNEVQIDEAKVDSKTTERKSRCSRLDRNRRNKYKLSCITRYR